MQIEEVSNQEYKVHVINSIKKKHPDLRQASKAVTFALTYAGTWRTLVNNLGIPEEQAKAIEQRYHELYSVSDEWVDNKLNIAAIEGYITCAFGLRLRTPLLKSCVLAGKNAVHAAGIEIAFHDSSKFSEDEFDAYRRHFHRTDEEILIDDTNPASAQEAESNFQKAWEHHYMNNNHHPQWWCYHDATGVRTSERVDPIPMSLDAIIHMICDWSAMSLKFDHTYSPLSWYATADKEKSFMHPETKRIVEELLNNLFGES